MSVVIKGGTVVSAEGSWRADVLIEGERILEVGPDLSGTTTLDASGCLVMPGGIDPHTHLEMPFMGTTTVDDFENGTRAALAGGTTTVIDFCLPAHGQPLMAALADWDRRASRACADYSFHMAIVDWDAATSEAMGAVVARGVTSFKHFMAYKGALMVGDAAMFASFRRCAELGALPLVHAENGDVVAALQQHFLDAGITGPEAHGYSRPPEVEGEAANRAIMLADQAGVPLYIVHTSSIPAHEAIRRARAHGQRVFGESLIQHLLLDETEYLHPDWDHAARRVMSPPFRAKHHQEDLWNGLRAGSIAVVATDHCAFTTEQKRAGRNDFTKIPNGTGGLEDRMPLLWTFGVGTGRLTPSEFVAATSTNPARIFGLFPRKGAVMAGSDADLVVWDPTQTRTVTAAAQVSAIDYNVFEGLACEGVPRFTLSRGEVVFSDGRVIAEPGRGRFLPRPAGTPVATAMRLSSRRGTPQGVAR